MALYVPIQVKADSFSQGLAAVYQSGKWGYIDKSGAMIIEPQFESALCFSQELARVKKDGLWGFINQKGSVVIKPQFGEDFIDKLATKDHAEAMSNFSEGLARVCKQAEKSNDLISTLDRAVNPFNEKTYSAKPAGI